MNEIKEIKLKKEYYQKLVEAGKHLIKCIKEQLVSPESYRGDFQQSNYENAKLQIELIEAEMQQAFHEDYFEHYKERCAKQELFDQALTTECNAEFDKLVTNAKLILENKKFATNQRVVNVLNNFLAVAFDQEMMSDQQKKNDAFKAIKDYIGENIK